MDRPPTSNFGGTVPPRFPPLRAFETHTAGRRNYFKKWGITEDEVWLWSAGSSPADFLILHGNYPVEDSMKYIFEVIITPAAILLSTESITIGE